MAHRSVAHHDDNQPSDDFSSDLMPPAPQGRPADPPPDRGSDVIIRSKVRAPVLRDTTLTRPRLLQWLDQHADDRVRVLAAEAGFGKTTLLTDWAHRTTLTVRWLKLDPMDAEWASFISYLVAAFQEGLPSFGDATQRMLGHVASLGITREQVTGQFLAELGAAVTVPTVLILDDLQHVQGNADVQAILERVIERAPHALTFILSGRSRPEVRLGRLTAQGNVGALGTEDLRFTPDETRDLFAKKYGMPLDHDLVAVVDARTEGWGASLQLLYSSVRGQRSAQVRDFIESLEGHRQPLYDFLAEEVLGRQEPEMQTVLLHAAVLDRIVPRWVDAALSVLPAPPDSVQVMELLDDADDLGLMSRNAEGSSSRRFHPLMHEFMASHLAATVPAPTLRLMHLRVAEAAESMHWPTSAHHFIEAGEGEQAMRVISDATITALGTGAWGSAIKLLERIPEIEPTAGIKSLQGRFLASSGQADEAVRLLEEVDIASVSSGRDRAVIRLSLANALSRTPRHEEVPGILTLVVQDKESPSVLAELANTWANMLTSHDNLQSVRSMQRLILVLKHEGLHLYTALAHHNLSLALLAHGDPVTATEHSRTALDYFQQADDDEGIEASAHLALAQALYDMGQIKEAVAHARRAVRMQSAQPDVFGEAALLLTWTGSLGEASVTCDAGWDAQRSNSHQVSVADVLLAARAAIFLARGDTPAALDFANRAETPYFDQNQGGLVLTIRAAASIGNDTKEHSREYLAQTIAELERRRILRWMPHARLLETAVAPDSGLLHEVLSGARPPSDAVLLVVADALAPAIGNMDVVPASLDSHVRRWPDRWRPILRRALGESALGHGFAAAALLSSIGDQLDVANLNVWEKRQKKWVRDHRYSDELARRISPTLMIRDLGRSSIALATRQVMITDVRRRAATLLLYLVSRPRHSATREQVLEALWTDQDPELAANSLHQTLYFLRRDLVAHPTESRPLVEYVPVESDLVYLVPELVQIESAAFLRQALEVRSKGAGAPEALSLVLSYFGQFAPEFEYEEWAIGWRDQVHSVFLDLAEQASRARLPARAAEAAAILRHTLEIDPSAIELRGLLAAAMYLSGSHAAARVLYHQYALECEREFGERPTTLAELVASLR